MSVAFLFPFVLGSAVAGAATFAPRLLALFLAANISNSSLAALVDTPVAEDEALMSERVAGVMGPCASFKMRTVSTFRV